MRRSIVVVLALCLFLTACGKKVLSGGQDASQGTTTDTFQHQSESLTVTEDEGTATQTGAAATKSEENETQTDIATTESEKNVAQTDTAESESGKNESQTNTGHLQGSGAVAGTTPVSQPDETTDSLEAELEELQTQPTIPEEIIVVSTDDPNEGIELPNDDWG